MRKSLMAILVAVAAGSHVQASDMRFCDLAGEIESAVYRPNREVLFSQPKPTYDLTVTVAESTLAKGGRDRGSYTDCSEFAGVSVDIRLDIPKRFGTPRAGDRIEFYYSAIDVVGVHGHAVSVCAELLRLDPANNEQAETE